MILLWLWCAPLTFIGLALAAVSRSKYLMRWASPDTLVFLVPEGGWLCRIFDGGGVANTVKGGIAAMTLGQVVLVRREWYATNKPLRLHEQRHVWQCLVFGVFQPVLYGIGCVVAWACGLDPYRGCFFEVDARRAAGEQ